nr:TPA_exp: ArzD - aKG/Fe(II) halogenase [Fischerella sp. PCC 9339]
MTTTLIKERKSQNDKKMKKLSPSWFRALIAIVVLAIYGIYEVVFVHKFFLHTFFRSSISNVPPPIALKIGYWNKLQFKAILLIRYFLKDQFWGQQWLKRVHRSILENLNKQDIDFSKLKMPIPTVELEQISAQEFWKTYVRTNTPVIIKGGAKHTFAYQNWTLEMFRERFGDFRTDTVNLSSRNEYNGGTLHNVSTFKDVIDSRESNEKLYIVFCTDIFSAYPELVNELSCLDFRAHMGGNAALFAGAQLFLGAKPLTGTDAHCADGNNLFFQICGKKKWTFVHPDYLWLMYPMLDRFFLFCASFVKRDYEQVYLDQYAPLQKYCPKYEAVLEPGDVLLNPPWQWHAIDNLTGDNIAVATRWSLVRQKRANTFFDFMQLFSPKIWRIRFDVVTRDPDAVSILDKRTTDDLVKNKSVKSEEDFVGLGNEDGVTAWDFDKWPKEYQF